MIGRIALRVGKDRPGQVRPNAGTWRKSDRTQEIAVAVFDSTEPGKIHYRLEAPRTGDESTGTGWQPTEIMEQASRALQDSGQAMSYRAISACVRGKATTIRAAVDELIRLGHITTTPGARNSTLHQLIKPYPGGETLTDLKAV